MVFDSFTAGSRKWIEKGLSELDCHETMPGDKVNADIVLHLLSRAG